MKRLDLAEVVLTLKASGVEDVAKFRWLEAPDAALAGARAHAAHRSRRARRERGADHRRSAAACSPFPAHPRYARMLLAAHELGCVPAVALIAALTQGRNLLRRAEGKQMEQDREDVLGESARERFLHPHARAPLRRAAQLQPAGLPPARHQCARRARGGGAGGAVPAHRPRRRARHRARATLRAKRSSAACSPASPTWSRMRLDARHAALRARPRAQGRARAGERGAARRCSWPAKCARCEMRGEVETLLTLATAIRRSGCASFSPRLSRNDRGVFRLHAAPRAGENGRRAFTISCCAPSRPTRCRSSRPPRCSRARSKPAPAR